MTNLDEMTLADLIEHQKEVAVMIKQRQKTEKAILVKKLEEISKEHGFDLNDILEVRMPKMSKKKAPVKYRDTINQMQTWTGKGRKPKWLVEALASGQVLEEMRVDE
jgi:DNA-binding protein H-NS